MKHILTCILLVSLVFGGKPEGKSISYKIDGKKYEGYFVSPSASAPLVIIIHDWDGLTDYEKQRAEMLADLGFAAFAADLYGAGIRPTEFKDKHARATELYQDRGEMRARIKGALHAARDQKANIENAALMGYCFGGAATLEGARAGMDLKAFVAFHGGLDLPEGEDYSQVKGEILILHGSADQSVSMDDFAALAKTLEATGVKHEMISYSGAPHAFSVFGSERYREDADRKSWQRFTQFLEETLKGK
jgi:dienelactone hydrolase